MSELWIAFKMWRGWRSAGDWLSKTVNIPRWVPLILLVLSGGLFWRLHSVRDEITQIHVAQADATKHQTEVNHEPARKSAEIARKSDAQAPAYYAAVRVAADAHRMRNPCPISNPDLPGTDRPIPSDDHTGEATGMVSRPKADDDLIVSAAAQAAQMQVDAQALIDAGIAVSEDSQ